MHTFESQSVNRVIQSNLTGASAVAGALKFPAFLLVWSIGVVLATGPYFAADALVPPAPIEFPQLQSLPSLADDVAFETALELQLRGSAVVAGAWQPQVAVPPAPEPVEQPQPEVKPQPFAVPMIEPKVHLKMPKMIKKPVAVAKIEITRPAEQRVTGAAENARADIKQTSTSRRSVLMKRDARRALAAGENLAAYRSLMAGLSDGARDSGYLGLLAVAALASGYAAEARIVYEQLLVMEPDNEQWWAGLAISTERLGLEATSVYQEALARSDEDSKLGQLVQTRLQGLG